MNECANLLYSSVDLFSVQPALETLIYGFFVVVIRIPLSRYRSPSYFCIAGSSISATVIPSPIEKHFS